LPRVVALDRVPVDPQAPAAGQAGFQAPPQGQVAQRYQAVAEVLELAARQAVARPQAGQLVARRAVPVARPLAGKPAAQQAASWLQVERSVA